MKIIRLFFILSTLNISLLSYGQNCLEYHKSAKCNEKNTEGFKLSSLSRGYSLDVGKTVTYEVVLYGDKEIMIQCCTEDEAYHVRFKLISSINGDIIYDNKDNHYINNLNLALDQTELIAIEISVEPKKKASSPKTKVCIGMAIYIDDTQVRH